MGSRNLLAIDALESPYARHVNPPWVRMLELLGMNEEYVQCEGAHPRTRDGRRVLDFLSGYCVHNVGHNHPRLVKAVQPWSERAR